jgi:hypothetical protein
LANARKNTAAQWVAENPTLRVNEIGLERDTKKHKLGDGVTPWKELPYQFGKVIADTLYAPSSGSRNYVRFRDTEGNPLNGDVVTIVVDTATNEIADIIVEEI